MRKNAVMQNAEFRMQEPRRQRSFFLHSAFCILNCCAAVVACFAVAALDAQQQSATGPSSSEIKVLPLRGNIYVLTVAGGNITASVGKDGVLLVDSGPAAMADKVVAAVRDLSRREEQRVRGDELDVVPLGEHPEVALVVPVDGVFRPQTPIGRVWVTQVERRIVEPLRDHRHGGAH